MWSGAIGAIPAGYALCDGTLGTPNLKDKFIVCAGGAYAVGAAGGNINHSHGFTGTGHSHTLGGGALVNAGMPMDSTTSVSAATGITNATDGRPPYYALAYIMKL